MKNNSIFTEILDFVVIIHMLSTISDVLVNV